MTNTQRLPTNGASFPSPFSILRCSRWWTVSRFVWWRRMQWFVFFSRCDDRGQCGIWWQFLCTLKLYGPLHSGQPPVVFRKVPVLSWSISDDRKETLHCSLTPNTLFMNLPFDFVGFWSFILSSIYIFSLFLTPYHLYNSIREISDWTPWVFCEHVSRRHAL